MEGKKRAKVDASTAAKQPSPSDRLVLVIANHKVKCDYQKLPFQKLSVLDCCCQNTSEASFSATAANEFAC